MDWDDVFFVFINFLGGRGETLNSALVMTFSFLSDNRCTPHSAVNVAVVSEDVVSWLLWSSSIC